MISPDDICFDHDPRLDVIVIRTKDQVLTKISIEGLRSMDGQGYKILFEGIIAIIRGELPAGEPIRIRRLEDGRLELVKT